MASKTELIWFDRRSRVDDNRQQRILILTTMQYSTIRCGSCPRCSPKLQTKHDTTCLLHGQNMLFPPSKNSTSETLSRRNMPSYSCSSSHHLPTRLLQLCPLRSAFIHTTTVILGTTHCCSSNKRSQSQRPHHTYT